jgi:hypothetical protein
MKHKRKNVEDSVIEPKDLREIDENQFKLFFFCKVFDCIGKNTYKQYVMQCKENNDEWAINVHSALSVVNENIKEVSVLFQIMQTLPNTSLSLISKDVVYNSTPPLSMGVEWSTCQISGQHSKRCVRLMKGVGRGAESVLVHEKYFKFLTYLWYVLKLEHVIRNVTRFWINEKMQHIDSSDVKAKCLFFENNFADLRQYYISFNVSINFVHKTLIAHINHFSMDHSLL